VVSGPPAMPQEKLSPAILNEVESLKAQLDAANLRADTYLRKARPIPNLYLSLLTEMIHQLDACFLHSLRAWRSSKTLYSQEERQVDLQHQQSCLCPPWPTHNNCNNNYTFPVRGPGWPHILPPISPMASRVG
jgi:hypothetical protein